MSNLSPRIAQAVREARRKISEGGRIIQPASADARPFGVGGCCSSCDAGGPCSNACYGVGDPGLCYERVAQEQECEMKTVSGGQIGVTGQDLIDFPIDLDLSNYFMPVFVRLFGFDNTDPGPNPNIERLWKLTGVHIGKIPQECFDETNPVPATHLQGIFSDSWNHFQRDGSQVIRSGVRVRWGCFSRDTLSKSLRLFGFAPQVNTIDINVYAEVTGYCLDDMPCGWKPGVYPGDYAVPKKAA